MKKTAAVLVALVSVAGVAGASPSLAIDHVRMTPSEIMAEIKRSALEFAFKRDAPSAADTGKRAEI